MEISTLWKHSKESPRVFRNEWTTWLSKNPDKPTEMFSSYFYIKYKILITIKFDQIIFNGQADRFLMLDLID